MTLLSPLSRSPLTPDTPHSLRGDEGERWPVVDGIAYLRTGREALVTAALAALDSGDREGALVILLADQDDWWTGAAAEPARLRTLVRGADALSFRAAMDHLGFGRVGDYFAHRWSDPTYLAGLALLEAHWNAPRDAFELACGAGHYLRELTRRGVRCSGGDVVFAKLWLARHWIVGPDVDLVCFDAASPWPTADRRFDLVFCHDAFYFLEPKPAIVAHLRGLTGEDGVLAVAHIHNSGASNLSSGAAVSSADLARLFPSAFVYDDGELTRALAENRAPRSRSFEELGTVDAFSLIEAASHGPRSCLGGLAMPSAETLLAKNPLYGDDGTLTWPSERYRTEYADRATSPPRSSAPRHARHTPETEPMTRSRELVDLPARW